MTRWREAGLDFGHVAVNAATADFQRGDYGERMLDRLAAASIPPQLLQVEVTETVFLGRSADCVEKALRALHAAGIRIALDDFGTGYASLSHLKQFPVDLLKIDRSFINDLDADEDAGAIVRAVINMARSLGLQSVAEGVETQSQAIRLRADGCDQAQGFLYSRGVPASAVPDLLRRFNGAPAPSSAL
jgi:EAL domain-containing protein (putative c-di-GMP-specific phosphodiesterase class I)